MNRRKGQTRSVKRDVEQVELIDAESETQTVRTAMKQMKAIKAKISGKTVVAMAIVFALALATLPEASERASAQIAPGQIYLGNTGQQTTNEPGRTLVDHGEVSVDNLWATYAADIGSGEPLRLIDSDTNAQTNTPGDSFDADLLRVVVIDQGYNIFATMEADPVDNLDLSAVFSVTSISIPQGTSFPVVGSIADIELFLDDGVVPGTIGPSNTQIAGPELGSPSTLATVIAVNLAGDTLQIRAEVDTGSASTDILIRYSTSGVDTIRFDDGSGLEAFSDVDLNGQGLILEETDRDTGRFEGYLRLTDANGLVNDGLPEVNATSALPEDAATLRVGTGAVGVEYLDSSGTLQSSFAFIDTEAPANIVTGPAHLSSTQNQQPTFTGDVTDFGSGLDISEVELWMHEAADQFNVTPVIASDGTVNGLAVAQSISKTGAADGDNTYSFSRTPIVPLPTGLGAVTPNHMVDFQIRSEDMAGNIGFSDADGDSEQDGETLGHGVTLSGTNGRFDANIVRIDRIAPTIPAAAGGNHVTGVNLNGVGDEVVDRAGIRVRFDDNVFGVEASDFSVEYPSLAAILFPIDATSQGTDVYLTMAEDIPSDERPIVRIQGSVEDEAGNGTAFGSANVADGISPVLEVTLSGGSGTGTGEEGPDQLTNDEITITVTSDETLSAPPTVQVYGNLPGPPVLEDSGPALSIGVNTWEFTYQDAGPDGDKAVVVTGTDVAASGSPPLNSANNETQVGEDDERSFTLDTFLATPAIALTPEDPPGSGIAVSDQPQVELDFGAGGEISTVTITDAVLEDDQQVATSVVANIVRSADRLVNTYVATSDLAPGEYQLVVNVGGATDAAGNTNTLEIVFQFTVDPPLAECVADVSGNGMIEREEAVTVVVAYLLGQDDWTRDETLTVLTAYLLATPIVCT